MKVNPTRKMARELTPEERARQRLPVMDLVVSGSAPVIWLKTSDPFYTEWALAKDAKAYQPRVRTFWWDQVTGGPYLMLWDGDMTSSYGVEYRKSSLGVKENLEEAVKVYVNGLRQKAKQAGIKDLPSLLVLRNPHAFFEPDGYLTKEASYWRNFFLSVHEELFGSRMSVVILAPPETPVPPELKGVVTVIEEMRPDVKDLMELLYDYCRCRNIPNDEHWRMMMAGAGKGLTGTEFLSIIANLWRKQKGRISWEDVARKRAEVIAADSPVEVFVPSVEDGFDKIAGLENLKEFLDRTAGLPDAKGVLLMGVPGTGKSAVAKALGMKLGWPTLCLDFGKVFGPKLGETESRIRKALAVIEAASPCVLFIDEIEKGVSGVASSDKVDAGTMARVFGTFLQWLNDRSSRDVVVYVMASANDVSKLPPELLRAERWDAVFFLDLPTPEEREQIWRIWMEFYGIPKDAPRPDDEGWTGAEIKSCCRLATLMDNDLMTASRFVTPIVKTMGEKIEELRRWAAGRAVPASRVREQDQPKMFSRGDKAREFFSKGISPFLS